MARLYPVVHVFDVDSALENVATAKENGADGVFLINHGAVKHFNFCSTIYRAVNLYDSSDFKIGANFLGFTNHEALKLAAQSPISMLWCDNSGTDTDSDFNLSRLKVGLDDAGIILFGGVQFKYQPKNNLTIEESIYRATPYVHIPTLSGPATGAAADVDFVARAFSAANGTPLALASGVSSENVELFLPYVEHFLVASSLIQEDSAVELFDTDKLRKLVKLVHGE